MSLDLMRRTDFVGWGLPHHLDVNNSVVQTPLFQKIKLDTAILSAKGATHNSPGRKPWVSAGNSKALKGRRRNANSLRRPFRALNIKKARSTQGLRPGLFSVDPSGLSLGISDNPGGDDWWGKPHPTWNKLRGSLSP